MAMKNCFQVSTVSTASARAGGVGSRHTFSSLGKDNFRACEGVRRSKVSFSSSSTSLGHSFSLRRLSSHIVCKARKAIDAVQIVNETTWEKLVVSSESPVLVEFWAPWCGPCMMIAPVIDELAKEYAGKILCYKLDTDESPNIATKFGIRSIPTVLFFKKGERKDSVIGAVPKSTLTAIIEKYAEV